MNEVVERLIMELEKVPTEYRNENYNEAIWDVIKYLKGFVRENTDGWIPVSSGKLPEVEENYLVTRKSGKVNIGMFVFFANGGFFNPYDDLIRFPDKKVIAWQPLPEPYHPSEELGEPKPCVNTACAYHKENADCEAAEGCAGYEPPAEPNWQNYMMNRFMREN